jgi:hypothetical protein
MKAEDFDKKFDRGESVLSQLDLSKAVRKPIVEEIRQVRERLLAQYDGDLSKYVDHLIEEQSQDHDRLVTKEEVLRRKHEVHRQ